MSAAPPGHAHRAAFAEALASARMAVLACACLASLLHATTGSAAAPPPPDAVVTEIVRLVRERYVATERIDATVARLEAGLRGGRYRDLRDAELAQALTADLREASGDGHNFVSVVAGGDAAAPDWEAQERREERETNYGIPRVEILPGGVGYVRLAGFMEPQRTAATLAAAMQFVAGADSLIFDLRGNGGGYGGLPEMLATWFFDEGPTLLSTLETRTADGVVSTSTHTVPAVPGVRRVGLPVYVLVDRRTASAAEWFAYTLQAFGKARLVGEVTAGAAHMNSYFPLTPALRLSLSTARPRSAATGRNWEGEGVRPDVPCAAERALDVALDAARAAVRERRAATARTHAGPASAARSGS